MILYKLQEKIYNLLKANPAINWPVFDYIPEDKKIKYIVIGEDRAEDWSTKTWKGKEITTIINIWCEKRSMLELKKIIGLVEMALAVDFESGGYFYEHHKTGTILVERESLELVKGSVEITYRTKSEV